MVFRMGERDLGGGVDLFGEGNKKKRVFWFWIEGVNGILVGE